MPDESFRELMPDRSGALPERRAKAMFGGGKSLEQQRNKATKEFPSTLCSFVAWWFKLFREFFRAAGCHPPRQARGPTPHRK
jgi:hypothetical protein